MTDKRNIYLVEASPAYGKNYFLPYAVGTIAAYAFSFKDILDTYRLADIIYTRQPIEETIRKMDNPFFVGLSSSVWNFEYNKLFAKRLKEVFPHCYVAFGGHSVEHNGELLKENENIDFLMHAEGEETFLALLRALDKKDFSDIPNLSYRKDGSVFTNPISASEKTDYPSPYLTGIFDKIMSEAPDDIYFQSVIETTRGCPYRCSYCDWDSLKTRARQFPLDRIKKEIDWSAEHKITFIVCADSNLGMYDRDIEIAKYVVDVYKKTGYPQRFQSCFAKDQTENVYEINKILNEAGISRSATISFQSMSDKVLKNIGRRNMSSELFTDLMKRYHLLNIPTYSELILGLPGETVDSFREGLSQLLEAGQHSTVFVHNCDLLPNSIIDDPDYASEHGIISVVSPINKYHCEITEEDVAELSRTVIGCNTCPVEDWIFTSLYADCVQNFHCLGLLRCFALWLRFEKNTSYTEFYSALLDFILNNKNTLVGTVYDKLRKQLERFTKGETTAMYHDDRFGKVIWRHEEGTFLECLYENERFFSEIEPFLRTFGIENEIFDSLLTYQKGIMRLPCKSDIKLRLPFDFHAYFNRIYVGEYSPLERTEKTLHIFDTDPVDNWPDFARFTVWYGRKSGRALLSKAEYED